jgi:hypothetical protein
LAELLRRVLRSPFVAPAAAAREDGDRSDGAAGVVKTVTMATAKTLTTTPSVASSSLRTSCDAAGPARVRCATELTTDSQATMLRGMRGMRGVSISLWRRRSRWEGVQGWRRRRRKRRRRRRIWREAAGG